MAVMSSTTYRILSKSVNGLLTAISGDSEITSREHATVMLLVALRILEARKKLQLIGDAALTTRTATVLIGRLAELNKLCCPPNLAIKSHALANILPDAVSNILRIQSSTNYGLKMEHSGMPINFYA